MKDNAATAAALPGVDSAQAPPARGRRRPAEHQITSIAWELAR